MVRGAWCGCRMVRVSHGAGVACVVEVLAMVRGVAMVRGAL